MTKTTRASSGSAFDAHKSHDSQVISDIAPAGYFKSEQEVSLIIKEHTDLGYKAIIDGTHWGVIYQNEVFQVLEKNQTIKAYIKKVREDGRIDLSLYRTGHKAADGVGEKIVSLLRQNGGFLPLTDKTSPEMIYDYFAVSKKKYKIALGGLYKARLVEILPNGLRLKV